MKAIDITGMRFGKLVVIGRYGYHITSSGNKRITWLCECDCGKKKIVLGADLKRGHTSSCGCNYKNNGKNLVKYNENNKGKSLKPLNDYRIENDVIYIKVGCEEVMIDAEDLNIVHSYRIRLNEYGYAVCKKSTGIHRLIMKCPRNLEVDHINHNKLDNRKCNLRIATKSENQINRRATSNTGELCIHINKNGRYEVVIGGKYKGCAKSLEEAITLRNKNLQGTKQLELNYYLRECCND